jgi:flagellar basal body-associated protein FliL
MEEKNKKNRIIIISLCAILLLVIGAGVYLWIALGESEKHNEELKEVEAYIALEKETMLNDLKSAKQQYEELKTSIDNDSLLYKLELEQKRTQELLEELERTKATDAAEIRRLKNELATLRGVLENYVMQIDSLHRLNNELRTQNTELIAANRQVERERDNLAEERQELSHKVSLASQLDATNVRMVLLKKNGNESDKLRRAKQIKVSFTISKNITASTGEKTVYVRITNPNQEPLVKSFGNTFPYEDRSIGYSMRKNFEYTGEEQSLTLYWDIEETLGEGTYGVYIFVDGNMIGSGSAVFE